MLNAFFNSPLLEGLTPDEIGLLANTFPPQEYLPGSEIIFEGEHTTDIYIIISGEVEVIKQEVGINNPGRFCLTKLGPGEIFGEIAFLDNLPRSSSVRAAIPTKLIQISRQELVLKLNQDPLYPKLMRNISKQGVSRLRQLNADYSRSLQKTLDQVRIRYTSGYFLMCLLATFSVLELVDKTFFWFKLDLAETNYSFLRIVLITIPSLVLIKIFHYPLKDFGVKTENWFHDLFEGLMLGTYLTIILVSLVVIIRYYTNQSLDFLSNFKGISPKYFLVYPIHAYLQEFLARGVMQSTIQKFLNDSRGLISVMVSSLYFAVVHTHLGIRVVWVTFIGSVCFGLIYVYRKSLIEVSACHFIMGLIGLILAG